MKNKTKQASKYRTRKSSKYDLVESLKLALIPHVNNNFRPHIIRSWSLLFVFVAFAVGQMSAGYISSGSVLGDSSSVSSSGLLRYTNNYRKDAGLRGLSLNSELTSAAQAKVRDMFANQYWDHESPSGVKPWHWIEQTGYVYQSAGENLAKNFHNASATVQAWYDSPRHRANLLNKGYTDVGFATASGELNGKDATLIVAMYGKPLYSGVLLASAPRANVEADNYIAPSVSTKLSFVDRIGVAFKAMPPMIVGVVSILIIMVLILFASHLHRRNQPKSRTRNSVYYHHALIKGASVIAVLTVIVWLYGAGQI